MISSKALSEIHQNSRQNGEELRSHWGKATRSQGFQNTMKIKGRFESLQKAEYQLGMQTIAETKWKNASTIEKYLVRLGDTLGEKNMPIIPISQVSARTIAEEAKALQNLLKRLSHLKDVKPQVKAIKEELIRIENNCNNSQNTWIPVNPKGSSKEINCINHNLTMHFDKVADVNLLQKRDKAIITVVATSVKVTALIVGSVYINSLELK